MQLAEIGEDGRPSCDVPLCDTALAVCEATARLYQQVGFHRPWTGYLAVENGQIIGACGFKSPLRAGRVEIAYFTFPDYEGRAVATQMAERLIEIARAADSGVGIVAQTLPEENASTAILRKLGFSRTATVQHPEDGEVWEWSLTMNHPPTLRKPKEGRTIAVVGDVYRFLATGEETDGKYAMWEALVPPGGGPPPHIHSREEESFYILEGEVTFTVGEETIVATEGMFANMPVGSLHSFKNASDKQARMIISVAPAGLEKMFFEFGVPLDEGSTEALPPTKEEIDRLFEIAPKYGIEIKVP